MRGRLLGLCAALVAAEALAAEKVFDVAVLGAACDGAPLEIFTNARLGSTFLPATAAACCIAAKTACPSATDRGRLTTQPTPIQARDPAKIQTMYLCTR